MQTANPGSSTTVTFPGIPSGSVVGFQVLNAATGLVALARTQNGVVERPAGSGNWVAIFNAPVQGDLYLVVADWNNGVLTPATSQVKELQVTTVVAPGSSGLGRVADYVRMRLGGETFKGLTTSTDYGMPFVQQAIDLVKRRVMTNTVATVDEGNLDILILDYLGILASLALIPAARDWWGSQVVAQSTGNDPTEMVTYTDRSKLMDTVRDDLLRRLPEVQALAIPLIGTPRLRLAADGPSIDEDEGKHVLPDPRDFPDSIHFPGPRRGEVIPVGWIRAWETLP